MADTSLADYFNIAPSSTTWGIGQNALVQALPLLMQSRGTPNQQFGTALGMSLVSALLGYQARRSAAEQSLQAAELGSQLIGMQTPQERLALIKGVDSSNVQQNLLGLNARIGEQELQNQLLQRQKIGELTANAEFALGDLGTKLFEREIAREVAKQDAISQRMMNLRGVSQAGKTTSADKEAQDNDKQLLTLRREFNQRPETKTFSKLRDAARVISLAEKDPSAVSSMELAKRAVHLIEPGLAALQGEVSAVENSASVPGAMKAKLLKALTGEGGLDEGVRKGIINMAKRAYSVSAQTYEETRKFYEDEATAMGLDPSRISSFGSAKSFDELLPKSTPRDRIINELKARGYTDEQISARLKGR